MQQTREDRTRGERPEWFRVPRRSGTGRRLTVETHQAPAFFSRNIQLASLPVIAILAMRVAEHLQTGRVRVRSRRQWRAQPILAKRCNESYE